MTKIIVDQIAQKVKELFEEKIDKADLNQHSNNNYEDMLVSRCLAAYAINLIGGASIEDSVFAITDGSDDNGIDALYFNPNTKRIIFVQSKYIKDGISEPKDDEIKTFRDGIYDFLDGKYSKFNQKINTKSDVISAAKQFGVKFDIVLIYTSKDELAKHAKTTIDEMMDALNQDGPKDEIFKFHKISKGKIIDALSYSVSKHNVDLDFVIKDWGLIREPFLSYYGKISGDKIGEWYNQFGELLFNDNIRKMLGPTQVNEGIQHTANNEPIHFWYYNNGITLLAESIEKSKENRDNRDFGIFKASKASIVNGAQTVSVLGKLFIEGISLEKIEIPFRVIEIPIQNSQFKDLVTKNNNTQNTILPKDFISQDQFQIELQKQLKIMEIEYNIKRNENFRSSKTNFDIDEVIEALVMTSQMPNLAANFKKEVGRFYVIGKNPYNIIFNPSVSVYKIINSVEFLRKLKLDIPIACSELDTEEPDLYKLHQLSDYGTLIIGQVCYKKFTSKNTNEFTSKKFESFWTVDEIKKIIRDMCFFCKAHYNNKYLVHLFQNVDRCSEIYNSI